MFKRALLASAIIILPLQARLCLAEDNQNNLQSEPVPVQDARVTLPYKELKALLDAVQQAKRPVEKPKPPVASSLLSARYQMAIHPGYADGSVEIEAQSFSEEWTAIPLIDVGAQIDKTEPADAQIIVSDGHYSLVTNHPGKTKVSIHFGCAIVSENGHHSFEIPFAPAAIRTLSLSGVPEGQITEVAGATIVSAEKGTTHYRLPKNPDQLVRILPLPEPPEPDQPSHWKIESQSLIRFCEGKLQYRTHVAAFADDGSGRELELIVPASARVLNVTGDDLSNWSASKTLRINWKTRRLLSREFVLDYEIPQPAMAGKWKLQAPRLSGSGQESSEALFAVVGEQGMEMRAVGTPPSRLPRWLAQCSSKENLVLVGAEGGLEVKWLPIVPTSPAVIDSARSQMCVVSDGALQNNMTFSIRNEAPLNWKLHLPAGSELLSCLVNGAAVNPVDRGEGVIELALNGGTGRSGTEVKISLMAHKSAFKPVTGQIELELPLTELLIQKLEWELQIPASYELAAIEGNVDSLPSAKAGLILLRKELCKNEHPVVRLFYQKPEARK